MLSIAIVGLPNVGKSTLFNALVETAKAEASNYPFTTIEPNVGIVEVPDTRLIKLAEIEKSKKIVPAAIKFVDIAGLVKGASAGEGLGNKFLSHIKETDAICMVVRCFEDSNITHVNGAISPIDDIKVIILELILADLEQVEKALDRVEKDVKSGDKEAIERKNILEKIKAGLEQEKTIRDIFGDVETRHVVSLLKDVQLITSKPMFFVANVSESQLTKSLGELEMPENTVKVCAKLETELKELSENDRKEYLAGAGVETRHVVSLQRIIAVGYEILDLISYLTAGEMESRAWTLRRGLRAPQAAGIIHTDFEKKFIAADVIPYEKFVEAGGWIKAREKGWVKMEGKEYVVKDGDVIIFKHG